MRALYRRAQAYIHLADLDLAEFDIKKALECDPDNRKVKLECKVSKEESKESSFVSEKALVTRRKKSCRG